MIAPDAVEPVPATTLLTDLGGRTLKAGSVISLTATAESLRADGGLLAQVSFYADNVLIASFNGDGTGVPVPALATGRIPSAITVGSPATNGTVFRAAWTVPAVDKLVNLSTVVTTVTGRSQVSQPVSVRVTTDATNLPPTAVMINLADGARFPLGTTLNIPVNAADPDAQTGTDARPTNPGGVVARVEYYINRARVATSLQPPFGFSVTPSAAGTYVLNTIVTDGAGLSNVAPPIIIQIVEPVTVSLQVPNEGVVVAGGAPLKIKVIRAGDLSKPLNVFYRTRGDAASGVDFQPLSGTLTIPAGQSTGKIKVRAFASDQTGGDGKRLIIVLKPSPDGSYVTGKPGRAQVRIVNATQ